MMHWGDFGWSMGFGSIWMIIFWGLVIAGIVYFIQTISGRSKMRGSEETPLDILKKRYAKGEISKDEFEKMKDDLTKI